MDEPIVGKLATVSHEIEPGKAGEIVVHIRGGTETYMATADAPIAAQTQVLVIRLLSARTVEVTPFLG